MTSPLVSVLIPSYERAHTLERAIDSALGQSFKNLEVVVSDNASTDGTMELLSRYAGDPRVRVVVQERNIGPVANWQAALSMSRGRFIKVNWSDDWMEPNVVMELLEAMTRNPNAAFAICGQVIHQPSRRIRVMGHPDREVTPGWLTTPQVIGRELPVSPGAGLIHRRDAEWALGEGLTRLSTECVERAIGPDLLMLYGAFRHGRVGVHASAATHVNFEGGSDSITVTSDAEVLSRCYGEALRCLLSLAQTWFGSYFGTVSTASTPTDG